MHAWVCVCMCVFESLPVKDDGREGVHFTHFQSVKRKYLVLFFFFFGAPVGVIQHSEQSNVELIGGITLVNTHLNFLLFQVHSFLLAGHQGSSQSNLRAVFGSFKLPTCDWLQKGRSHTHTEFSLVF